MGDASRFCAPSQIYKLFGSEEWVSRGGRDRIRIALAGAFHAMVSVYPGSPLSRRYRRLAAPYGRAADHLSQLSQSKFRPSAPDEPARDDSPSVASRICHKEWNPHRQRAAAHFKALSNEVYRKPVGDEEPNWIGQHAGCDGSPRFLQAQQLPQSNALVFEMGSAGKFLSLNHGEFFRSDRRMVLGPVIEPAPQIKPYNAERAR